MNAMLRTSEFWMAVAVGLGQIGVAVGLWTQDHFNNVLLPAITYIVGRILSKTAKTVVKEGGTQ